MSLFMIRFSLVDDRAIVVVFPMNPSRCATQSVALYATAPYILQKYARRTGALLAGSRSMLDADATDIAMKHDSLDIDGCE
eukprot:scaffold69588_cov48-Attheya_sp.AAC.2